MKKTMINSNTATPPLALLVVIINYKTPKMLTECLDTLLPELSPLYAKAVVIDNASNDGSVDYINDYRQSSPYADILDIVPSSENLGFSGGNNLGIKHAVAQHYLLLNSDTLIRPGAINTLMAASQESPNAGLISPRLEWEDATPQISCFRYRSPASELIGAACTGPITKLLGRYDVPIPVNDEVSYPEWTSFACVMIRREVIEQIGLMDEGYFLYFEDIDYSRRAKSAGWEIMNVPSAHVVHLRGGSSPVKENTKQRKRVPKYYYASRSRYFYKFYGRLGLFFANMTWYAGRTIAIIRELIERKPATSCEKEWLDIWTYFLSPNKKFRP